MRCQFQRRPPQRPSRGPLTVPSGNGECCRRRRPHCCRDLQRGAREVAVAMPTLPPARTLVSGHGQAIGRKIRGPLSAPPASCR